MTAFISKLNKNTYIYNNNKIKILTDPKLQVCSTDITHKPVYNEEFVMMCLPLIDVEKSRSMQNWSRHISIYIYEEPKSNNEFVSLIKLDAKANMQNCKHKQCATKASDLCFIRCPKYI